MTNTIVKSLLIGLIAGSLIGLTGKNWDFDLNNINWIGGQYRVGSKLGDYGTTQAVIGGIMFGLTAFLIFNKDKK